jgi:hypothetical protein
MARNAGVEIPDGASLYRLGGYPRLGLAPLNTKLSKTSSALLEKQLIRAEHKRGNEMFMATGLTHLDPRLANELASVYLGLAEKFRGVTVERIDFCRNMAVYGDYPAGVTSFFSREFPQLYSVAQDLGTSDLHDVANAIYQGEYDRNTTARVDNELSRAPWSVYKRNAMSHGYIELSECISHPQCLAIYHATAQAKNISRARRGEPPSLPPVNTSWASMVLVHEFGHAVEHAILGQGEESWKYAIDALEGCILRKPNGRWRISAAQLREVGLTREDARLINYPNYFDPNNPGNGERRKVIRDLVGKEMSREIGAYAGDWLGECFAEAFMQAIISSVPETRKQLAPFLEAIYDLGLSMKRRHR